MPAVLDQTLDINGQELHRILSVYPLPDFVKEASQDELCGTDDLAPHQFADVTRSLYPIKNAASTVLSSVFFYEKKADMNPARAQLLEKRLLDAAAYFKVTDEVEALRTKVANAGQYDETELVDSDFAIVFDGEGDVKERRYPMRNTMEVKAAADWLQKNRDKLTFADRNKIASHVLTKAAKFGASIPTAERYELDKMAGAGACSGKDAAGLIRTRIKSLGHSHQPNPLQQELEKLAQQVESDPAAIRHYAPLVKIATVIDQFDREHGLHRRYDDIVQRPEDVLFAVTEKAAASLDNELVGSPLTGNYYKRADLQSLAVQDLADSLGEDFASAVSTANAWVDLEKLATIVPTLPLGDAEEFDAVASVAGIRPFAQKSAAVGHAISPATQEALAAQHKANPGSLWDKVG